MKPSQSDCPECGATLNNGTTCETNFHQMLFWEAKYPEYGSVHHLAVLCYHLQHPRLYSSAGLRHALGLLIALVEQGRSPAEVRQQMTRAVDSGTRDWTFTARPDDFGAYTHPIRWTTTTKDVVEQGVVNYVKAVHGWATATLRDLKSSANI